MRKNSIITGEYYHIYNRGVDKRLIFSNSKDLHRFIQGVLEFNQLEEIGSLSNIRKTKVESRISSKSLVSIAAYCFNPNHFHFILKQLVDHGISKFMKKVQGGYSCYFNLKNARSGSLFQGPFKANLINNENYFNKLLGYVNKNYAVHDIPKDMKDLIFSGDLEYKNDFKIITKSEGDKFLKIFGGKLGFEKHCNEIIDIIRQERGKSTLFEEDTLPV